MSRQEGRIHLSYITDDEGGYLENQTSRLYRHLREHSGQAFSGLELDRWGIEQAPPVRNTSTRKYEICAQVDPAVEWIDHWEGPVNEADPKSPTAHFYRHRFTAGQPPADSAWRCAAILEGKGEPVRGAGVATRWPGGRPAQRPRRRPARVEVREPVAAAQSGALPGMKDGWQ